MTRLATGKVGEQRRNTFGSIMEIVEYKNYHNITVKFIETDNLLKTSYDSFKSGKVRNPYDKALYGVGYNGVGRYRASENGNDTFIYMFWKDMMKRCYSSKFHEKRPLYRGCVVAPVWHSLQNFGEWFDNNYYKVDDEVMNLDKDILVKGNKTYSPETCIFVPRKINSLFVKNNANRGDCPIGVRFDKRANIYVASYRGGSRKGTYIGSYKNPIEAFYAYKDHKEAYIKQIADQYKGKIPSKLYEAMYSHEIEITD